MGRYYSGDIEGKFWFAVQNSDAADRFGVTGVQPQELYYYFQEEDLESVEAEIKVIENTLGKYLPLLDQFFKSHPYYSDDKVAKALNISIAKVETMLNDYADLALGRKIRDCIKEQGSCEFTAEY